MEWRRRKESGRVGKCTESTKNGVCVCMCDLLPLFLWLSYSVSAVPRSHSPSFPSFTSFLFPLQSDAALRLTFAVSFSRRCSASFFFP